MGPPTGTSTSVTVVTGLPDKLDERPMDWLEINSAIFAADRAAGRDPGLNWNRSIELHVPVRDPRFWSGHSAAFEDIFSSLTYDRLSLNFHGGAAFAEPPRTRTDPFPEAECIALLSSGAGLPRRRIGTARCRAQNPSTWPAPAAARRTTRRTTCSML